MDAKRQQFESIYDQNIAKIYRFVYLKVNSQEVAEDITSRVFLKGWEAYQKNLDPIGNISAFLYQIARNMVTDYYRNRGRTQLVSADQVSHLTDPGKGVHEQAAINADMEIVRGALGKIKKEYQDVVIWHYIEGYSAQEIGSIINRPAGTVRVMIHRGLEALRDQLNQTS